MQAFTNAVFHGFLKELTLTTPKGYFNSKKVIQSSVGMIFKLYPTSQHSFPAITTPEEVRSNSYERIQLLFTQRAGYKGDRNAFNIVFPGGQCDEGESDFQACKRELKEEIGLKVDQQCLYLGQIPRNFYYLGKRGKDVFITCHVWCMKQDQASWKEKLNSSELCDSKWVDFADLLNGDNYLLEKSLRLGILQRIASKYKFRIIADLSKQVLSISTPELNLGMRRNLWGLTLWLWSYALQMACTNLARESSMTKNIDEAKRWIQQMESVQVDFKPGFLLKYPALAIIKSWHYFYRTRPFTYHRKSSKIIPSIIILILFGIFCYLFL